MLRGFAVGCAALAACGRIDFDLATPDSGGPSGSIAWRSTSTTSVPTSGALGVTIDAPAGVAAGDVLVATIAMGNSQSTMSPTFTVPAGWTQIRRDDYDIFTTLVWYGHAATTSEPANYTWGFNEVIEGVAWISAYTGVDTAMPIDVADGVAIANTGPAYATPSITTTVPNALVLGAVATHDNNDNSGSTTWSKPAGTTERAQLTNGSTRSGIGFELAMSAAGPTGAMTATASEPQDYALGALVAMRPAP